MLLWQIERNSRAAASSRKGWRVCAPLGRERLRRQSVWLGAGSCSPASRGLRRSWRFGRRPAVPQQSNTVERPP